MLIAGQDVVPSSWSRSARSRGVESNPVIAQVVSVTVEGTPVGNGGNVGVPLPDVGWPSPSYHRTKVVVTLQNNLPDPMQLRLLLRFLGQGAMPDLCYGGDYANKACFANQGAQSANVAPGGQAVFTVILTTGTDALALQAEAQFLGSTGWVTEDYQPFNVLPGAAGPQQESLFLKTVEFIPVQGVVGTMVQCGVSQHGASAPYSLRLDYTYNGPATSKASVILRGEHDLVVASVPLDNGEQAYVISNLAVPGPYQVLLKSAAGAESNACGVNLQYSGSNAVQGPGQQGVPITGGAPVVNATPPPPPPPPSSSGGKDSGSNAGGGKDSGSNAGGGNGGGGGSGDQLVLGLKPAEWLVLGGVGILVLGGVAVLRRQAA